MFGVLKLGKLGASMKKAGFNPRTLFAASEPGAWYDTSDMSTLFQDSAGTVPVTAVEQPVGRILDKSGRGNHAIQATTTKRPVLSARVNLVSSTALTSWGNNGSLLVDNGPSGFGANAYELSGLRSNNNNIYATVSSVLPSKSSVRIKAKAGTGTSLSIDMYRNGGGNSILLSAVVFDNPAVSLNISSGSAVEVTGLNSEWATIYATFENPVGGYQCLYLKPWVNATSGGPSESVIVTCPQVQLIDEPFYGFQRVTNSTDYDADPAKFPAYLSFDGVDDALQTGNIDFTSTDKMTVWAGITKLSDAVTGTVVELSASKNANNGVFALFAPLTGGSPDISWYSKGANERAASSTSESAPVTRVITGIGDISGDISSFRVNGAVVRTETADQGPGNFGNYPLYIGASAGTSLYFNGRLYGLIVRGAQSTLSQIEATELYIKQKMRMP